MSAAEDERCGFVRWYLFCIERGEPEGGDEVVDEGRERVRTTRVDVKAEWR